MIKHRFVIVMTTVSLLLLGGCGYNKKSGRDARREQIRNNAESKRKELKTITGQYYGDLQLDSNHANGVTLNLEINDIPQEEEGEVDPIMVPTLAGYVKFNFGSGVETGNEQINFKLSKANFDSKTNRVDLIASNESFKDILLTLDSQGNGILSGKWSAPDISKTGDVKFSKSANSGGEAKLHDYSAPSIAGEYQGYVDWEKKNKKQLATLTLVTALSPPDGITLGATVRVFLGDRDSNEFLTYNYDDVQFNPIDGKLTISNSEGSDITFAGALSDGVYKGRWSNRYDGDVGGVSFQKSGFSDENISGDLAGTIEGDYSGVAYWERENAYQHTLFTVVSTLDESSQLQVAVTAKLIFGDIGSQEYMTYEFPSADFNPWTQQLILKRDESEVSFVGFMKDGSISGNWSSSFRGNMGAVDLNKNNSVDVPSHFVKMASLKGTFQGSLENTNPDSNLPERFQVSFITSRDLSEPSGIKVSGSIRFYLGQFGSLEYIEINLEEVRFNFFTRELIAVSKSTDSGKYTITARAEPRSITGKLSEDALGEVANIEVDKI